MLGLLLGLQIGPVFQNIGVIVGLILDEVRFVHCCDFKLVILWRSKLGQISSFDSFEFQQKQITIFDFSIGYCKWDQ